MRTIPEKDWKILRSLNDEIIALACEHIFKMAESIAANREGRVHSAYLDLYELLQTKDKEIALLFDDIRRSNAFFKLAAWKFHGLLTDEQLEMFSGETQEVIKRLAE